MKPIPEMARAELEDFTRQLRKTIRCLGSQRGRGFGDDFVRASRLAICGQCGLELIDHPLCADEILHVGCDGRLLKL